MKDVEGSGGTFGLVRWGLGGQGTLPVSAIGSCP